MTVTRRSGAAGTGSTSITTLPSAGSAETGTEMGQSAAAGQQNKAVDAAVQLPAAMPAAALPKSTKSSGNSKKGKGSSSGAVTAGNRSNGSSSNNATMGQVDVDIAVVDALPSDPVFPAAGFSLQPVDARDALLMLCAKAMASVDNRAMTPKEIALICSRKWNWTCRCVMSAWCHFWHVWLTICFATILQRDSAVCSGQLVHTRTHEPCCCKRLPSHIQHLRARICASARGHPLSRYCSWVGGKRTLPGLVFKLTVSFSLRSARPSVKRGTFWFLSEAVGFPSPFPHRRQQGPALASSSKAVSSSSTGGVSAAPVSLLSQGVLKSNGIEEKPLTRAQRVANQNQQSQQQQPQPIAPKPATMPAITTAATPAVVQQQLAFLQPAPQINKDPLGRGKRKRTASQFNNALPRASMPSLQQVRGQPALAAAAGAGIPGGASATSAASAGHRRAFSSSASDVQKPQRQSLQKLRLRLSAVSEAGPTITPGNSPSSNASLKKASSASRVPVLKSSGSTKQPLSKRARTQSMSQLPSATSTFFPFDNLHLPFLTPHGQPAPAGTVFPLDIHNMPHWPASAEAALDLLTSRSAPEGGIFSPPQGTANVISGPFSRSHSPSASVHLPSTNSSRLASRRGSSFRAFNQAENSYSAATSADIHSIAKLSASLNALDDMDGVEYAEASRSLTDSAILAAQREVLGLLSEQDYHEDMLAASDSEAGENTEGIDFDFETSMDSLAASKRRGSRADDLATIDSAGEEEEGEDSFDMGLLASRSLDSTRRSQSLLDTQASAAEEGNVEKPDAQQDEDWEHVPSDVVVKQEEVDMIDEDLFEDEEEYEDSDSEPRATMDSQATYRALNTTLCPAAAGALGRPGKLNAARRLNSSSSLVFTRSPLLRPASISRTNSRDVLNTPVPLAELPVIPLMPPQGLLYHLHGEGERSQGSQSTSGSGASTPLTPVIKSEEETDDFGDATNSSRGGSLSRLPSQALTEEDDSASSSADSFRPEAYVSRGTASIPEEGGPTAHSASRSQSSSRQTSLSPRDSFSPQACSGSHADWALTPPSESEEQYNEDPNEEEEKLLDRATVLGIESVGMDDLEDAWPGSLVRQTADLSVFEPTMEAPPLPAPIEVTPTLSAKKVAPAASVDKVEDVDMVSCTTEDDAAERGASTSSAAMFIAEEEGDLSQSTSSLSSSNSSITGYLPDSNAAANSDGKNTSAPIHVPGSGWFYSPERPFDFPISVLLTETKVLFYSTVVSVPTEVKGESTSTALLRRVDNDAVDGEALLLSLMQKEILRNDDKYAKIANTLANIKHKGNQWISLEFARGLLKEFGEGSHVSC